MTLEESKELPSWTIAPCKSCGSYERYWDMVGYVCEYCKTSV